MSEPVDCSELPRAMQPSQLTDKQREFVQSVYRNEGKNGAEIVEDMPNGASDGYASYLEDKYPDVFYREDTGNAYPGIYLSDMAKKCYEGTGLVEPKELPTDPPESLKDPLEDLAESCEEPSQKHRKGNVTYEGPALDMSWQTIKNRPVKSSPNPDSTDEPKPAIEPETVTVSLSHRRLFELIRTSDVEAAWTLYSDLFSENGE